MVEFLLFLFFNSFLLCSWCPPWVASYRKHCAWDKLPFHSSFTVLCVNFTVPSCFKEMQGLTSTDHFIFAPCYRFYTILFSDSKFRQNFQRSFQNGVVLFLIAFFLLPLAFFLGRLLGSCSAFHTVLSRNMGSLTLSDMNMFPMQYDFPLLVSGQPEIFLLWLPLPPYFILLITMTQIPQIYPQIFIEQGHVRRCKGKVEL